MDLDIEQLALLKCKGGGGGSSVTVEPLTVTQNGTTTAPEGKAYSPVTVNVPSPALNPLSVTANGTYTPTSGTGYSTVTVAIPVYAGEYQ